MEKKSLKSQIEDILEKSYGKEISEKLLSSFQEINDEFATGKWKASEMGSGHFVESARRAIEFELFGAFTPFSKEIDKFNDQTLKKYENITGKDEAFRIVIPRVLWSIYTIRNKRGVGHASSISPNVMDATFILSSVKWVLAEIIRIKSSFGPTETQTIVEKIVEREIPLIWNNDGLMRILNPNIPAKNQVLIHLYVRDHQNISDIRVAIEYKNATRFENNIVTPLHKKRLIEFDKGSGTCHISPLGTIEAEQIIHDNQLSLPQ
jgi:hypothetical protein